MTPDELNARDREPDPQPTVGQLRRAIARAGQVWLWLPFPSGAGCYVAVTKEALLAAMERRGDSDPAPEYEAVGPGGSLYVG